MAAALLGHLEPFDPSLEEWTQYVERLEQFFEANEIVGDAKAVKRRATFLSIVGRSSYNLLRSLLAPVKPTEKSFEELVALLTKHYSPKPTEVMQRFRFNSRLRQQGESVATYVAELRKLAQDCNYGDSLDKMLRDRLVWGVKEPATQKKLLAETELTLEKAIQIAQSVEVAEQNLKEMGSELERESLATTNKVSGQKKQERSDCYRCGNGGHQSSTCPFRDRVCHKCKKKGHLAKVCRSSSLQEGSSQGKRKPQRHGSGKTQGRGQVGQLDDGDSADSFEDDELLLAAVDDVGEIKGISRPPIKVPVTVDGKEITMELDTGASVSIISEKLYKQLWPRRSLENSLIRLQTYSKQPLGVLGTMQATVCYEQQKVTLPVVVVKGEGAALFGRNWLDAIQLDWIKLKVYAVQYPSLKSLRYVVDIVRITQC